MTSRSPDRGSRLPGLTVLRRKAVRIGRLLESRLGTPSRPRTLPRPLDMLVATILSQNTNDGNSHRAYSELKRRFPTWAGVARARTVELRKAIRTGGMAQLKSRHISMALHMIHDRYGRFDLEALRKKSNDAVIEELTALPGVGVKTAACVLLFSLGRDVFPVDTHVHRLCTRLGLVPGSRNPEETFTGMKGIVPPGKAHALHTNLIRFGRTVCRPAKPHCGICPLYAECQFEGKNPRAVPAKPQGRRSPDFMLLDNVA